MKKTMRTLSFCLTVWLLFLPGTAIAGLSIKVTSRLDGLTLHKEFSAGENHALVIGINQYQHHPNLRTAVNDAEAAGSLLEDKYLFSRNNIIFLKDAAATKASIFRSTRRIRW
jgi:Caspase domain